MRALDQRNICGAQHTRWLQTMAQVVKYTVFQRTPIAQWSSGTTVVVKEDDSRRRCSFDAVVAAIECDMGLPEKTLAHPHFLGIIENKLVADKTRALPVWTGPVQVCIAERSIHAVQNFPTAFGVAA